MKRILFIGSVIVLLSTSSMASAQETVDVTKITCDELVKYEIADPKRIESWMCGYYYGTHNYPIIDRHQMLQGMDKLKEYCFKNPNALVMAAAEILGLYQLEGCPRAKPLRQCSHELDVRERVTIPCKNSVGIFTSNR